MSLFKLFLFLFPVLILSSEVVWDGDGAISVNEQKKAIREYVQMKYPDKLKAWTLKEIKEEQEKKENIVTVDGLIWQDNVNTNIIEKDWLGAKDYCTNLHLIGYNDWYLPSKEQLEQLYIQKNILKYTASYGYWSSSDYLYNNSYAWLVYFYRGDIKYYEKSEKYYVRCVRNRK